MKRVFFLLLFFQTKSFAQQYDVCVYGGTSAGVIAAYTAAKLNKKVILVEPGKHLGGLSSGGLGYTDIGNKYVVSGLARDFYRRMGKHYGKLIIEEVLKLKSVGKTNREIGEKFELTLKQIKQLIKRYNSSQRKKEKGIIQHWIQSMYE